MWTSYPPTQIDETHHQHTLGYPSACPSLHTQPHTGRMSAVTLHPATGCCLHSLPARPAVQGGPLCPQSRRCHSLIPSSRGQRLDGLRPAAVDTDDQVDASSVKPAGTEILDQDSDTAKKEAEIDKLRAAEKFMKVGSKNAVCNSCQYEYEAKKGDPEYPVGPNTAFTELPQDWQCPVCGAEKNTFRSQSKTIAGFASNQQYGFGGNGLTAGQKSLAIYGSLLAFFGLFIAGYFIQ